MLAEGTYQWGQDNWYYVVQRGRWVRTIYYRRFPARNNPYVYDLFANGQFVRRVDSTPPAVRDAQLVVQLQQLIYQYQEAVRQQAVLSQQQALARAMAAGMTIGGGTPTPNHNPLTVTDVRLQGTPAGQISGLFTGGFANAGTAIVLGQRY